ncbi:hypothetical protein CBOM_00621 [Ceraceosorus bombacis]|uniref:Uncharacterized protein n=1 Tax=Ceraceosorus bombacis TaxID=401625 RepID=A0A0P1BAI3_9BASI|nr:hypothetical protein CBOM_00621 [Ceraceosorus bombacis]
MSNFQLRILCMSALVYATHISCTSARGKDVTSVVLAKQSPAPQENVGAPWLRVSRIYARFQRPVQSDTSEGAVSTLSDDHDSGSSRSGRNANTVDVHRPAHSDASESASGTVIDDHRRVRSPSPRGRASEAPVLLGTWPPVRLSNSAHDTLGSHHERQTFLDIAADWARADPHIRALDIHHVGDRQSDGYRTVHMTVHNGTIFNNRNNRISVEMLHLPRLM